MRHMSKILYDAPEALRTLLQGNLVAAADAWNAEKDRVLGVQGSRNNHAPPGEPPRRQTGHLRQRTVAVAAAAKLEIQVITTEVGKYQDRGTSRMRPHPFVNLITNRARSAMRDALHRRK